MEKFEFNKVLKHLIEEKGISISELSKKSGIHRVKIHEYLRGETKPKYESAEKLATALNVPVIRLLGPTKAFINEKGNIVVKIPKFLEDLKPMTEEEHKQKIKYFYENYFIEMYGFFEMVDFDPEICYDMLHEFSLAGDKIAKLAYNHLKSKGEIVEKK